MAELINNTINSAITKLSSEFIYRKLGLCYDYPAVDGVFPLQSLPKANETSSNQPDSVGRGTGMYNCILNNAMLFDGLANRFELGFATEQDDVIFDRLIGGTIRLGTVAPNNLIIRGLTGDGRYFYSDFILETAFLWAFTSWRTITTAAVAVDSQIKLINIITRWSKKFSTQDYQVPSGNAEKPAENPCDEIMLLAILAICADVLPATNWKEEFTRRLSPELSFADNLSVNDLLMVQLSLKVISEIFNDDEAVNKIIKPLRAKAGQASLKFIDNYKDFNTELSESESLIDWRTFKKEDEEATPTQLRIKNEEETVTASVQATLVLLMSDDSALLQANKERLKTLISSLPYENIILATSLSALASVHAKGVENKLWDEELSEFKISFPAENSLVAEYLEENYDETHEEKAGHTTAPKKKPVIELSENDNPRKSKKKKRRRRKPKSDSAKNSEQRSNNSGQKTNPKNNPSNQKTEGNAGKTTKKKPNRRRRNKKKRPSAAKQESNKNAQ